MQAPDSPIRCIHCDQAGSKHRVCDAACPPPSHVPWPRLSRVKDEDIDRVVARYWTKGPGTTYEPLR